MVHHGVQYIVLVLEKNTLSWLDSFIDEKDVLQVGGRLRRINIPSSAKHPPILPRKHPVTTLILEWIHRRNGHIGTDYVLSLLCGMCKKPHEYNHQPMFLL